MIRNASVAVAVSAVDRFTGPMSKVAQSHKTITGQMRDSYKSLRTLQGAATNNEKLWRSFGKGSSAIREHSMKLQQAQESLKSLSSAVRAHDAPTVRMRNGVAAAHKKVNLLSAGLFKEAQGLAGG